MSDLLEFDSYLARYQIRDMQDLIKAARKFNYLVLPFEPNDADVAVMAKALTYPTTTGQLQARNVYQSLVDRRVKLLEFTGSPDIPAKAPKVRQD